MRWAATGVVLVLLGATLYEVALALRWLTISPVPGEGRDEERVLLIAVVAGLVGAALLTAYAARPHVTRSVAMSGIPAAAAAFMTARFYTFDPYYAPTFRRLSDDGFWPPAWVFSLVACSLIGSALTLARPRVGSAVSAVVVVLSAVTAFAMAIGH